MHPSAYTQRLNAAYARIQAAGEFLTRDLGPSDDAQKLSDISHPDANMRALLKLEATTNLVVRLAQGSGYEEQAPEPFKPNEFVLNDQLQPVEEIQPAAEETRPAAEETPDPEDLSRPSGRGRSSRGKNR
jgi:hypothetical protein